MKKFMLKILQPSSKKQNSLKKENSLMSTSNNLRATTWKLGNNVQRKPKRALFNFSFCLSEARNRIKSDWKISAWKTSKKNNEKADEEERANKADEKKF